MRSLSRVMTSSFVAVEKKHTVIPSLTVTDIRCFEFRVLLLLDSRTILWVCDPHNLMEWRHSFPFTHFLSLWFFFPAWHCLIAREDSKYQFPLMCRFCFHFAANHRFKLGGRCPEVTGLLLLLLPPLPPASSSCLLPLPPPPEADSIKLSIALRSAAFASRLRRILTTSSSLTRCILAAYFKLALRIGCYYFTNPLLRLLIWSLRGSTFRWVTGWLIRGKWCHLDRGGVQHIWILSSLMALRRGEILTILGAGRPKKAWTIYWKGHLWPVGFIFSQMSTILILFQRQEFMLP